MTSPQSIFIIGIAGGTGSGKTTIVKNILDLIPLERVSHFSYDDYYLDQSDLEMSERVKVNYDHPNALETPLFIQHLTALKNGKSIERPVYDFVQNTRTNKTVRINPAPVILIEGILLYENKAVRDLIDLKVFVDTDDDTRLIRKIRRDMSERGRELSYILHQYETFSKPMHEEFVIPTRKYADVIIPDGGENHMALGLLQAKINELVQQVT